MIFWVEAMLVGALGGLVGVQVVLRRLSFFTMALTHATFPGAVAAAILGFDIHLGGAMAGVVVAAGVAVLARGRGQNPAAATGVLLSGGFALGVGLLATRNGFGLDLSAFLVGSIVTVTARDVALTAAVLALAAIALTALGRPLLLAGFDPDGARAAGLPTRALDLALLLIIEAVVVTIMPAVGAILALALLVAPAAAARLWTGRFALLTPLAVVFGVSSGAAGLAVSSRWNVAAGAAITLAATAILLASLAATRLRTGRAVPWRPGSAAPRRAAGPG